MQANRTSARSALPASTRAATAPSPGAARRGPAQTLSKSASQAQVETVTSTLSDTLRNCLTEVQRVALAQEEHARDLKTANAEITRLTNELESLRGASDKVAELEELNLKLKAQLLSLERSKSVTKHIENSQGLDATERQAFADLKRDYTTLENYYAELLAYVKGRGDVKEHGES